MLRNVVSVAKEWFNSKLVRQYTANTGWMLATRAAWIISAFTIGIYVARKLGPYKFGVLNYAIALTGIFAIIVTMSVEEFVIRQLVKEPDRRDRILGNFLVLRLFLFAAMALVLGTTLLLLNLTNEVRCLCLIIACGYAGFTVQGCALYFQANVESKYFAIPQLLACLINSVTRGLAAWYDWPLAVFALAEATNNIIPFGVSVLYYWQRVASPLRFTWDWRECWSLLKTALPLAICGIFYLVYYRTDQLMIEYFMGPEAVGYYSLAARFTENWAICIGLLCGAFFPAVVTAAQISQQVYHKQLHRLYFLVFWSMAAAAGVTVLLGRPVIHFFFGAAYLPTVPILYVFVWSLLGSALLGVFSHWAINEKRIALIAWSFSLGAVINIILNPILIKGLGINGAAWSTLISMPVGLVLILLLTSAGRDHLGLLLRGIITLPSFKLGPH